MNIPPDIDIQLAKNVNKYHRVMKMHRKNRFSPISSWHSLEHSSPSQWSQQKQRQLMLSQMTTQDENESENENDIYENREEVMNEKSESDKLKYDDDVISFAVSK